MAIIEGRISAIKGYLLDLEEYKKYSQDEVMSNQMVKFALERLLYLVSQACIDLGEEVIAYKKLRKPTTHRDTFDVLGQANIISQDLELRLGKMAGFRNVIAHDYVKIDYTLVYNVLHTQLAGISEFVEVAEKL